MNSSPPSRLVCRLARRHILGLGSHHLETCDACAAFLNTGDALDSALKLDASRLDDAFSPGLDQRIIHAVRRSQPAPRRSTFRLTALSFVSLAACAAIAVVVSLSRREHLALTPSEATALLTSARTFSTRLWDSVQPSAIELSSQNPLRDEINLVYSDARSALGFLALNFLPTSPDTGTPFDQISPASDRS